MSTRYWSIGGAAIIEINARKLTQKLRLERPVWMKQIEDGCTRFGSIAERETKQWLPGWFDTNICP